MQREGIWEGIKAEPRDKRERPLHQVKEVKEGAREKSDPSWGGAGAEALEIGLEGPEKVCYVIPAT